MALKPKESMFGAIFISAFSTVPAVLVAAILLFISQLAISFMHGSSIEAPNISEFAPILMLAFIGVPFGLVATLLYGLPVYLILRKIDRINRYTVTIVALIPALLYSLYMHTSHGQAIFSLYTFIQFGYFSLWVAYAFWWFAPKH